MKRYLLCAFALFVSSSSFAGGSSYICKTSSGSVVLTAVAAGLDGHIDIYYERGGRKNHYSGDIAIKPGYSNETSSQDLLLAIPTTNIKKISERCERMHIIRADGTECYGREAWSIRTEVSFLISLANGNAVFTDEKLGHDSTVEGKTDQGYIHDRFSCLDSGITSPGGCFAEQDSRLIEWIEAECP
ncbi:MAG: hypothetical protein OM95_04175 [Bdellovibrio sp. ArHS]|uniref:hypothetical protein n=1 Tax=Bdellovibrio sp. ArHS TaxID=1569284 RepID=UPI0005834612|nr:hypothetical protein [Bdellovibrio sp. ArHS]KHD89329.1 MAG: hypothetical protein OM95_04175 [Bdellovibrio sp. ArHS]